MKKGPLHIAIILDGNRRYAQKHKLALWKGHELGAKKVEDLMDWWNELGVKELTLYSFSTENFNRSKNEIDYLMNLFRKQISKLKKNKQKEMRELMEKTRKNNGFIVNFAMGYGGRQEIVDAVNKLLSKGVKEIDEKGFEDYLCLKDKPDLLIRPGGEMRISNFLLWQMAYTEFYFTDKLWPEFTKKDLVMAVEDYKKRERRFGK